MKFSPDHELAVRRIVRVELDRPVAIEIRLSLEAIIPTQPYPTDACWDLYAIRSVYIQAHDTVEVPTGVYINIPAGYEGELKTRSSWGRKGLIVHHATYDCGYQGEVSPFVQNFRDRSFDVRKGDRVAQFCLRRKVNVTWKPVDRLSPSDRGTSGHGSSGR